MASEEQQAINRKLVEANLFKAKGAAPQQAETDAFQCGKCKQKRTIYYQVRCLWCFEGLLPAVGTFEALC
jgi:transcription elongation factor S-II